MNDRSNETAQLEESLAESDDHPDPFRFFPLDSDTRNLRERTMRSRTSSLRVDFSQLAHLNLSFERCPKDGTAKQQLTKSFREWDDFFCDNETIVHFPEDDDLEDLRYEFETTQAAYSVLYDRASHIGLSFFGFYLQVRGRIRAYNLFYVDDHSSGDLDEKSFFVAENYRIVRDQVLISRHESNPLISDFLHPAILGLSDHSWSCKYEYMVAYAAMMYEKFFRETDFGTLQRYKEKLSTTADGDYSPADMNARLLLQVRAINTKLAFLTTACILLLVLSLVAKF